MPGVVRVGQGLRAAFAIVAIVGAGTVGMVAAGARDRGAEAPAAPGLRADLLPAGVDRARAPALEAHDARGGRFASARLAGRPYLVTFVYTSCRDVCPLIGDEVAEALRRLGPRARDVAGVAISVDPRGDTRPAARRWLAEHRLPPQVHYLIGSYAELLPVWRGWFVAPPSGRVVRATHDASLWLVDARGRLRGRWSAGEPIDPADVAHDLAALLDEA